MKKILVCCNRSLNIGGIEKALTTFLKMFDFNNNDLTLVLHDVEGILTAQLPVEKIKIVCSNEVYKENLLRKDLKEFNILEFCKGIWNRILLRTQKGWYENIMYTHNIYRRKLQFKDYYDVAISFTTDYSDLTMVLDANTEKRYAFVHADASKNPQIARYNDSLLQRFDRIFCVSESSKELFLKVHPKCKEKMAIFHNIVIEEEILAQANEPDVGMVHDGTYILCTVGRLSIEKGQDMIPEIAEMLRQSGYRFCWYLVGNGPLEEKLREDICVRGLEEQIKLLGHKLNPYPYMKNCDIYVQTSYTEAYCITIHEARVLQKPIVTTPFTSVEEQIEHKVNGWIAEAMTPQSVCAGIKLLMDNPELTEKICEKSISEKTVIRNCMPSLTEGMYL